MIFRKVVTVFIIIMSLNLISCTRKSIDSISLEVINPYLGISIEDIRAYKTNLHTHSTISDGAYSPCNIYLEYKAKGFDLVALTDHNIISDSNQFNTSCNSLFNNTRVESIYFDFNSIEFSRDHHLIGLFFRNDSEVPFWNPEIFLQSNNEQVFFLAHPGTHYHRKDGYNFEYYSEAFNKYKINGLIGLEIYNRQSQIYGHPGWNDSLNDVFLWDKLLTLNAKSYNIFGFATDDFHESINNGLGYGYTVIYSVLGATRNDLRNSLYNGFFLSVVSNNQYSDIPILLSVEVIKERNEIAVEFEGDGIIKWYSGLSADTSSLIAIGNIFNYTNINVDYVRAVYETEDLTVYLQPFLFRK